MKNVFANQIKTGTNISDEIFAVRKLKKAVTKDGKPYADIELADKTGSIKGKIWSEGLQTCDEIKEGDVIRVFGKVGEFNNQPQLIVSSAIQTSEYDLADFIATTEHDIEEMKKDLEKYLCEIKNKNLKALLNAIFTKEKFDIFCEAPAAYTIHHAYKGGMLEHTIDMLVMAEAITKRYPDLNRDLLYTGIILHDLGKLSEYSVGTTIQMTTEGKILGHIYLGAQEVKESAPKDMPIDLLNEVIHMILAHQGSKEFGSPIVPKTPEAVALSVIDDASFKINTVYHTIKSSETEGDFTDFQRHFATDFYKSPYHGENN